MMKRRVESLIEREYLERVESAEVSTYAYLA
jgi:cullin 3